MYAFITFYLFCVRRERMRARWEREWVRKGSMSCLPHQSVLHIKVMLRQSDDTKSLVSMNLLSTWTGWRWCVCWDEGMHLDIYPELSSVVPQTSPPPFVDVSCVTWHERLGNWSFLVEAGCFYYCNDDELVETVKKEMEEVFNGNAMATEGNKQTENWVQKLKSWWIIYSNPCNRGVPS